VTRALVLRLSALGDVIHTIPAVMTLRSVADVTWTVEAPYRELVELVAGVPTIPVRIRKWSRAPIAHRGNLHESWRALRSGFDLAVDFQGLIKSASVMRASGAVVRYGFDRKAIREKQAAWFANRHVPVDTTRHVVDQNQQLAGAVVRDLTSSSTIPPAPAPDWNAFVMNNGLDELAGSVVLLPGAGKPNKLWPVERFRELARRIGPQALAVWGPGERELAEGIGARVAPPTSLRELAWILQHARAVVGADTGPLHLADALGTPLVGLYGPTNPRRNGPYSQLDHCIDHFTGSKSMESISVEEVVNALERVRRP
jgi:heptosyltransferase-1